MPPLPTSLNSSGVTSQSIEGMLRNQPGIHAIKVALLAERGVIEYDPKTWNPDKLISVSLLILLDSTRPSFIPLGGSPYLSLPSPLTSAGQSVRVQLSSYLH